MLGGHAAASLTRFFQVTLESIFNRAPKRHQNKSHLEESSTVKNIDTRHLIYKTFGPNPKTPKAFEWLYKHQMDTILLKQW